jgi:hypothetical protein
VTPTPIISRLFARLRPRMTPSTSERALRRYIDQAASEGIEAFVAGVIGFYRDEPVAGVLHEPDADRLLFQYGTYDWGEGPAFEIDVTRQFAHAPDGALSQLHATAYYAPDAHLQALGADDVWFDGRADADRFAQEVLASPAIAAVRVRPPLRRIISWEMV